MTSERVAAEAAELVVEAAGVVGGGEPVDPFGGGGEGDAVAGLAGADRQADREVGLAGAGRTQEHDVVAGGDEIEGAEVGDDVAFEGALVVEVELLEGLAGREAGGTDADLTAVGLAGGDLTFEAGSQELFVAPVLGCGLVRRAAGGLEPSPGLSTPGTDTRDQRQDVDDVVVAISRPRRCGRRRRGRVPRRTCRLAGAAASCGFGAHCSQHLHVLGSDQRLMAAQEAAMPGHFGAFARGDDFVQGDADVDPAADETRVHRVVVGVDPHEVIPWQPHAEPPRRVGQHRRKRQHRATVLEDRLRRALILVVAWIRMLARRSQPVNWALKSSTPSNRRPGRKLVS